MTDGRILAWDEVALSFGPFEVLSGVSLSLAPGQVLALVGPSGCGKTTLLQMAAGLLDPSEGAVRNGFSNPACVFQEPRLLPWRRAVDNIAFGLTAKGVAKSKRRAVAEAIGLRLGLGIDDLDKYPHEMSGGMRQRVSLGRALAIEPDLLLLDEPFSALDVGLRRELQNLLMSQIEERALTALFITHDLAEAVRVSHEIAVMDHSPHGIVGRHQINRPFAERTDGYVYERVADLLSDPVVSKVFRRTAEEATGPTFKDKEH